MNSIKEKILGIAPELFVDTPVQFAYLYGSVAKGIENPFSDLDLAIYVEGLARKASLDLELSLSLAMDKLLDNVIESEIRIINFLPLIIQGDIVTTGSLIFSQNEAKRIDFETRLRIAYFDFLPVIRNYERVYFENEGFDA
jgi:uncharacterized protein